MSRTFVHLPYWVKTRAPAWRHFYREDHRHDEGPCDLDRFDPRAPWSATRCHIEWIWAGRNIHCGCRMCTGRDSRAASRRAARAAARRFTREAVKTAQVGRDALDPPAGRHERW